MWFKNLSVYQYISSDLNEISLSEGASELLFRPCKPSEEKQIGFYSPFDDINKSIIHSADGCIFFCIRSEIKKVPNATIKAKAKDVISQMRLQNPDLKKVPKSTVREIELKIKSDLLPYQTPQSTTLYGYIDTKRGWIVIDSSSRSKSEDAVCLLEGALGSRINYRSLVVNAVPCDVMSGWVTENDCPDSIEFGNKCTLRHLEDLSLIRYSKFNDIDSDDQLITYLRDQRTVSEMSLTWSNRITFSLSEEMIFKGIKCLDEIKDKIAIATSECESQEEDVDVIFSLMQAELGALLERIIEIFGGICEDVPWSMSDGEQEGQGDVAIDESKTDLIIKKKNNSGSSEEVFRASARINSSSNSIDSSLSEILEQALGESGISDTSKVPI